MKTNIWLNIGCGKKHINGFVNMDMVKPYDKKLDARKGLPYKQGTVDGIYSEHFFEHLTVKEGLIFLRECRRVLKSTGTIRIAMPDLDAIIQRYNAKDWRGDGDMFNLGFDWVQTRGEMLNIVMREWGHKHLYNEEELVRIANMAGFTPLKRFDNGKSEVPEFQNKETRNSSKLIMEFSISDDDEIDSSLVSVLMPVYRATFFKEAIESAINQTYQNIEIIVTDDSETDEVSTIVHSIINDGENRISYYRNNPQEGSLNNYIKSFSLANGKFIKFLNDDDVLLPSCIEKMVHILSTKPSIKLVTSYRKRIDESGKALPDTLINKPLAQTDCEIDAVSCANAMCSFRTNFIGEPSSVMFRKSDLSWVNPNFMSFSGTVGYGAGDVAMWLNLLGRGNAYYFADELSQFRIHDNQRQKNPEIKKLAVNTWWKFISHSRRLGMMPSILPLYIKIRFGDNESWKIKQMVTTGMFIRAVRFWFLKVFDRIFVT